MLKMRNALLSPVSSQQLFDFGNNEVQMPNLDLSVPLDSKGIVHGTSFYLDSKAFNDGNQLRGEGFAFPHQPPINFYQEGYQSTSSECNDISQQLMLRSKIINAPETEMDFQAIPIRKRPNDLVENKTALSGWKINKRKKLPSSSSLEDQWHLQVKQQQKVSVRRSQKLSDKITALQKLVSPYGKTDTASVLQEASLYIKLLQEQIRNLFQMLSSSYSNANPLHYSQSQEIDGEVSDLKSKGFCLVPMSFTEKLTAGRTC